MLAVLAAATGPSSCSMGSQARPVGLPPERVFSIAKPAMALIQVDYKATLSYPKLAVAKDKDQQIVQVVVRQVQQGKVDVNDTAALNTAYDRELLANPAKYFSASKEMLTSSNGFQVMGSGFMASREGFIATSAHVVATSDDEIKKQFSSSLVDAFKDPAHRTEIGKADHVPDDLVAGFSTFLAGWIESHVAVTDFTKTIHVAIGKGTPGLPLQTNGVVATVAAAGDPIPGKDVAVLKIDAPKDYATLAIGNENDVQGGDPVSVVGYPGEAILKNQDTDPRQVSPSESHGPLNFERKPRQGYSAIGARADASPGESGGPVIDRYGRVVGVTAYILVGPDGKPLPRQTYAVPASVLREFLARARVHPQVTDTTRTYQAALAEFSQQHYRNALEMFRQVRKDWPDHPFVGQYIADAEHAIVDGRDRSGPTTAQIGQVAAAIVVLLAALVAVAWLLVRRRSRRRRRAAAAVEAAAPGVVAAEAPSPVPAVAVTAPRPPRPRRAATSIAPVPEPAPAAVAVTRPRRPAVPRAPRSAPVASEPVVLKPVAPKPAVKKVALVKMPVATTAAPGKTAAAKPTAARRVAATAAEVDKGIPAPRRSAKPKD